MKMIKSVLALSMFAATAVANAATIATFTYSDASTVYGVVTSGRPPVVTGPNNTPYGSNGATGTGELSDTGTLTLDIDYWYQTAGAATHKFDANKTVVLTGTVDLVNNVFNVTSSTTTINSCVNTETNGCANVTIGPSAPSATTLALSLLNPTLVATDAKVTGQAAWIKGTTTYTPTLVPEVPVPAAAWLFGSGLLGLAGTARRRKAQ